MCYKENPLLSHTTSSLFGDLVRQWKWRGAERERIASLFLSWVQWIYVVVGGGGQQKAPDFLFSQAWSAVAALALEDAFWDSSSGYNMSWSLRWLPSGKALVLVNVLLVVKGYSTRQQSGYYLLKLLILSWKHARNSIHSLEPCLEKWAEHLSFQVVAARVYNRALQSNGQVLIGWRRGRQWSSSSPSTFWRSSGGIGTEPAGRAWACFEAWVVSRSSCSLLHAALLLLLGVITFSWKLSYAVAGSWTSQVGLKFEKKKCLQVLSNFLPRWSCWTEKESILRRILRDRWQILAHT